MFSKELLTNQSQQRSDVHLHLRLTQDNSQLVQNLREGGINVPHNLGEDLVQGFQEKFHEAPGGIHGGGLLGECSFGPVEVDVPPESLGEING